MINEQRDTILEQRTKELGSITLVTAVVLLPILFFLLTISLDLTQLYSDRSTVQRLLDEAALQGYRFLPFSSQARQAVDGHLKHLNSLSGSFETLVSSDSVEVLYNGVAPFTFASFLGLDTGIPYQLSARVRGTVLHAVLALDTGNGLAPQPEEPLWGSEGLWPAARLFTNFQPFGSQFSDREITQQCFNPIFSGLKRSALRLFDYLSSFSKNSIAVAFYPGTLAAVDLVKDGRRSGVALTRATTGYFNIANGPVSKNSFCLAATEMEPLESIYRLPDGEGLEISSSDSNQRFTDPVTYLVPETSLSELSVREVIWTRAIKPGSISTRTLLLSAIDSLSSAGQLNSFEAQNRLAQKPVKATIILTSELPHEGTAVFPDQSVKDSLSLSLRDYWRLLGGGQSDGAQELRKGVVYYVVLGTPSSTVTPSNIEDLQEFFSQSLMENQMNLLLEVRVVYSENPEDLAVGVTRSLVLENNTAVIDG